MGCDEIFCFFLEFVVVSNDDACGWKRFFEGLGVSSRNGASIKNENNTFVGFASNESSHSLFQAEKGTGKGVVRKGGDITRLEKDLFGCGDGVVGAIKGEFFDDDTAEVVTTDIHSFPKA